MDSRTLTLRTGRDFTATRPALLETPGRLVKLLNECVSPLTQLSVGVRIGAENKLPSLCGCTIITSPYSYGHEVVGRLGVVGPVRMEYARMINVVNYVARLLEQALADAPRSALN